MEQFHRVDDRLLSIYLNDHLAAMVIARGLAERCRMSNRDTDLGAYLATFLDELQADGEVLEEVMRRAGARRDPLKQAAAWVAERAGRLKLNGRLFGYSDLSRLEEVEALCLAVEGKLSLWRSLERLGAADPRIAFDFEDLVKRARAQRTRLERFRTQAAIQALTDSDR